jgi:hypothetical protein
MFGNQSFALGRNAVPGRGHVQELPALIFSDSAAREGAAFLRVLTELQRFLHFHPSVAADYGVPPDRFQAHASEAERIRTAW